MDNDNLLQRIQQLQFNDRSEAEALLRSFIRDTFPLDVQAVELRPQATSLNSFNGFLTLADEKRLFFKTHTESDTVIDEYYNAEMLANAGYPVIQPIHSSTKSGQQLLIYEVIEDPAVFDLSWLLEHQPDEAIQAALTRAQNDSDDQLLQIYLNTLEKQSAADAMKAPVHQLFIHRLVGGRMERFYGSVDASPDDSVTMTLPNGRFPMTQIFNMQWVINEREYPQTLGDLVKQAITLLNPMQAGLSVIGHGDAHNGNVFFRWNDTPPSLLYFDPAFAGRHHPLLDLTKPLFHNVFAMWMYFPQIKKNQTMISVRREAQRGEQILHIKHNYMLSDLRMMFLRSKVERVLIPIVRELKQRRALRDDWRQYLKVALFCCPFLTLNLADDERFPPEISLLGLAMCVEMGAESSTGPDGTRSLIDQTLDEVEAAL